MSRSYRWWASTVMVVLSSVVLGCGSNAVQGPAGVAGPPATPATGSGQDMDAAEDHSAGPELSAEDKVLADAQKMCPVSDEELGGMGPPVKMLVKGEPIFLCCKGCEKRVNADPDKYLAKVAELKKTKQEGETPKN